VDYLPAGGHSGESMQYMSAVHVSSTCQQLQTRKYTSVTMNPTQPPATTIIIHMMMELILDKLWTSDNPKRRTGEQTNP
jgi:hypothetical protein